jgi:hypothetical protein
MAQRREFLENRIFILFVRRNTSANLAADASELLPLLDCFSGAKPQKSRFPFLDCHDSFFAISVSPR